MARGRQDPDDWEIEYDPTSEISNTWGRDDPVLSEKRTSPPPNAPVAIEVNELGHVTDVSLSEEWKRSTDPRNLHTAVLTAVQEATMRALAGQLSQEPEATTASHPRSSAHSPDSSPLSKKDIQRLLDDVQSDFKRFTEKLSERTSQPVTIASSGNHVQGTASKGQISQLWIDSSWASSSRSTEVESELSEVLKQVTEKSSPGTLVQGPQGRAIDELYGLVSDPQLFLRRIGLPPKP